MRTRSSIALHATHHATNQGLAMRPTAPITHTNVTHNATNIVAQRHVSGKVSARHGHK
ncbi:hypothetical protein [Hydrogenophilus islandicus]